MAQIKKAGPDLDTGKVQLDLRNQGGYVVPPWTEDDRNAPEGTEDSYVPYYAARARKYPGNRVRLEDAALLIPNPTTGAYDEFTVGGVTYDPGSGKIYDLEGLQGSSLDGMTYDEQLRKGREIIENAFKKRVYMKPEDLMTVRSGKLGEWWDSVKERLAFDREYFGKPRSELEAYYKQNVTDRSIPDISQERQAYLKDRIAWLKRREDENSKRVAEGLPPIAGYNEPYKQMIPTYGKDEVDPTAVYLDVSKGRERLLYPDPSTGKTRQIGVGIVRDTPGYQYSVGPGMPSATANNLLQRYFPATSDKVKNNNQAIWDKEHTAKPTATTTDKKALDKQSSVQAADVLAAALATGVTGAAAYGLAGFVPSIHEHPILRGLIGAAAGLGAGAGTMMLLNKGEKKEAALKKTAEPKINRATSIFIPSASGQLDRESGELKFNIPAGISVESTNSDGSTDRVTTDAEVSYGADRGSKKLVKTPKKLKHTRTESDGTKSLEVEVPLTGDVDLAKVHNLQDALGLLVASEGARSLMNQSPEAIAVWRNKLIKLREQEIDRAADSLRAKGKNLQAFGLKHKDKLLASGMGLAAGSLGYIGSYAGLGMIPWFKQHKGVRFLASLLAGTGVGVGLGRMTHKQLTRHYHPTTKASLTDLLGTAGAAATDAADALHAAKKDISYKDIEALGNKLNAMGS